MVVTVSKEPKPAYPRSSAKLSIWCGVRLGGVAEAGARGQWLAGAEYPTRGDDATTATDDRLFTPGAIRNRARAVLALSVPAGAAGGYVRTDLTAAETAERRNGRVAHRVTLGGPPPD